MQRVDDELIKILTSLNHSIAYYKQYGEKNNTKRMARGMHQHVIKKEIKNWKAFKFLYSILKE